MSEILNEGIKENLDALKMRNTIQILDNYLERAIKNDLNTVDILSSGIAFYTCGFSDQCLV